MCIIYIMNCKHLVLIAFIIAIYISYVVANTIVKVTEKFTGSLDDISFKGGNKILPGLTKYKLIKRNGNRILEYVSKNYIDVNIN